MIIALIITEIVLATAAQMLLRHGALMIEHETLGWQMVLEPFRNLYIFLGLAMLGLSFFLYAFILSKIELNILYPISTGATIVLVAVGSVLLLRETISTLQIVGIITIIVGIMMVASNG